MNTLYITVVIFSFRPMTVLAECKKKKNFASRCFRNQVFLLSSLSTGGHFLKTWRFWFLIWSFWSKTFSIPFQLHFIRIPLLWRINPQKEHLMGTTVNQLPSLNPLGELLRHAQTSNRQNGPNGPNYRILINARDCPFDFPSIDSRIFSLFDFLSSFIPITKIYRMFCLDSNSFIPQVEQH